MRRSLERAQSILTSLEERQEFDSLRSQIIIARAAVAKRRAELVRAAAAVRNAQTRIAALVNSPLFLDNGELELLPAAVREKYDMPSLADALAFLHQPPPEADLVLIESGSHP